MNLFEIMILNIVLIIFPILCYLIYIFFIKILQVEKNRVILDICLFTSVFLTFKYGTDTYKTIPIILIDIPLIIAYVRKRYTAAIIITLIMIYHYTIDLSANFYFTFFDYLIYLILLIKPRNKKINELYVLLIIRCILFCSYYVNGNVVGVVLFNIVVFYITTLSIVNLFTKTESMICIYKSLEKFNDDKGSKESLFKITHEIKNPIAVVKGYLDMFDVNNQEHSIKYIPIIKEEISRVLMLLEDFLCITKIKVEKDEMDLSLLLDDINDNFNLILKDKNVKLEYKQINELYIMADYNRLKQVLVNMIKNSREAIGRDGIIKINVIKNKSKVKIVIEDNGSGMSKQTLENLKEPFFTTKKNGTGLGIYMCNEIITAHNGYIKYNSKEGVGTKVTIMLPL